MIEINEKLSAWRDRAELPAQIGKYSVLLGIIAFSEKIAAERPDSESYILLSGLKRV